MTLTVDSTRIRSGFMRWQCLIRQHAVRRGDGRPTSGMRPRAELSDGHTIDATTTVMVLAEPGEMATQFQHLHRITPEPLDRYEAVVKILQGAYYQVPAEFSDRLTALFSNSSAIAERFAHARQCTMHYEQFGQTYILPCQITELAPDDAAYQATYWHNALFNPRLTAGVRVLAFEPDCDRAGAEPAVPGGRKSRLRSL